LNIEIEAGGEGVRQIKDARVRNHQQTLAGQIGTVGNWAPAGPRARPTRLALLRRRSIYAGEHARVWPPLRRGAVQGFQAAAAKSAAVRPTQRKRRSYCHLARVKGSALDWRIGGIRIDVEFPSLKD
jgi:hypothetical protein